MHLLKQQSFIFPIDLGSITFVNDVQSSNADFPIDLTDSGIVISVNDVHFLKQ